MNLPELPTNHLNVLRRIRRCENEVAAQVVLEHALRTFAAEAVRLERERMEVLRHAGAMLSNCAFNLAQRTPGQILTADDISALGESRRAWDAARSTLSKDVG